MSGVEEVPAAATAASVIVASDQAGAAEPALGHDGELDVVLVGVECSIVFHGTPLRQPARYEGG